MARPTSKHPTELELEILKVLWRQGPSSVKQIQEALAPDRELAYTTIATMLSIMAGKKYLKKKRGTGGPIYEATVDEQRAAGGMLKDLVDRVYDGSTLAVIHQLLDTVDIDADELARIRKLINRKAKEQS